VKKGLYTDYKMAGGVGALGTRAPFRAIPQNLTIRMHMRRLTRLTNAFNERGDFRKQPSVSERFDNLLTVFTRRSLMKEEPLLWESFSNLKNARNALAHEGIASLGKRGELVDASKARKLVNDADKIISWIEQLLPDSHRRQRKDAIGPFARRMATMQEAEALGHARLIKGQIGELAPGQSISIGFEFEPNRNPNSSEAPPSRKRAETRR
jgi:hypothetical protein